jgi:hypothetical protein
MVITGQRRPRNMPFSTRATALAVLYHVVGCTERTPVGFFDDGKKNATDGFSQKDLRYQGEEKK